MTDAALSPPVLSWRGSRWAVPFAAAVFASATLVFLVQPMVAKLVLPSLGGAAAVWNATLTFFQAALLAGYLYAHLLQRVRSLCIQLVVHLAVLALAALALPLRITGVLGEPPPDAPVLWLLGVLAVSVGAPFAALSATAPLLQAWFARAHLPERVDPYPLYAASNLGSLLALLAYPTLVEPALRLADQRLGWSLGYGLFALALALLAAALWRAQPAPAAMTAAEPATTPPTWRTRLTWVLLAAAPSSLMLGVTTHLTTDIASAPFLWVAPLALYLLTFVVAFAEKPSIRPELALALQAAAVVAVAALPPVTDGEGYLGQLLLHLFAFFLTALVCHQALAARRPPPARLTEFYLLMSLGGVLGGAFNALLAPVLFQTVLEYPLVLVLACLARPWGRGRPTWRFWALLAATLAVALLAAFFEAGRAAATAADDSRRLTVIVAVLLLAGGLLAFLVRGRALAFAAVLAVLWFAAHAVRDQTARLDSQRSFFGVLRTAELDVAGLHRARLMAHGTTLHGAQLMGGPNRCRPMVYYAPPTPIGQAFQAVRAERPRADFGVVGLGTGATAGWLRPGDTLSFFEIDPLVARVASDPQQFGYLNGCAPTPPRIVLGDARLTLGREPDARFDLLLIDAFSSDSVPTHLLTVEAVRGYLRVLKRDGVLLLHLTNRNLDLVGPATAVAREAGAVAVVQARKKDARSPLYWDATETVVAIARTPEALAPIRASGPWGTPVPTAVRPWTDDYVNVFGALVRHLRQRSTLRAEAE